MLIRLFQDLIVGLTRPGIVKAAKKGDLIQIQRLLAAGVEVDVCDRYGRTALMEASRHGNIEVVRVLLERGADPNRKSFSGKSAFRYAATLQVREALSERPADVSGSELAE